MAERAPGPCGRVGAEEAGEFGDRGGQGGEEVAAFEGGVLAGEQVQVDAGVGGGVVERQDPGEGRRVSGLRDEVAQRLADGGRGAGGGGTRSRRARRPVSPP
ncbi:hypothetical protein ACFWVU_36810 [Streptomyces sp. NPDC058686]|uniref:hypothetical protein n=1 Tax=Streptomyces sp. NPDC058686 TaxID=3346599 RepID=UPI003651573F